MPKDAIKFPLSADSDAEFKKALDRLNKMPKGWHVVGVHRETMPENGVDVPVAVIDVEL